MFFRGGIYLPVVIGEIGFDKYFDHIAENEVRLLILFAGCDDIVVFEFEAQVEVIVVIEQL